MRTEFLKTGFSLTRLLESLYALIINEFERVCNFNFTYSSLLTYSKFNSKKMTKKSTYLKYVVNNQLFINFE